MKKSMPLFYIVFTLLLISFSAFAQNATAQNSNEKINIDFEGAEIQQFIQYISEQTGQNIITTQDLKGKVTIYSPISVSKKEALDTFVSIMNAYGYAIQKNKSSWIIVPFKDGYKQNTLSKDSITQSIETRIIPLKNSIAKELEKTLPAILMRDYAITSYSGSNTLAITAPSATMQTALAFIKETEDNHITTHTHTQKLIHANANVVADVISTLLKSRDEELQKRGGFSASMVTPDERTDTIIIYGSLESVEIAKDIIKKLDIPTPKGKGDVHHITLANGTAEDIAEVLNTLIERQAAGASDEATKDMTLSKDIKVVPDKATNSLVITARSDEFEALAKIIAKLDIVRQQVFIEGLIMEVASSANTNFGINWALGGEANDIGIIGGANLGGGTVTLGANKVASLPSGISLGAILTNAFSVGGTSYNIQSLISLSKGNSNIDILATPQLLTLDNAEAMFEVVDNIPFLKESTASNTGDFTTQTMDYKDVGVKLKIIPRISTNNTLKLEVVQEISRVTQGLITLTNGNQIVAPTTRKRLIQSTILLKDGQTAVIGGLLDKNNSNTVTEVPGVSRIPLFGNLFKSRNKTQEQTNLFIFITPKIIKNFEESSKITAEKKLIIHEGNVGKDGLGQSIISKPELLKPIIVY